MITKDEAVKLILAELERAETLHPIFPIDKIHAAAIVSEESGELVQACNDYVFDKVSLPPKTREEYFKLLMTEEAVQIGAMAIRFLINMDME